MNAKERFSFDNSSGTREIINVANDPTWGDVQAVESRRDKNGRLTTVVNHRDKNFKQICEDVTNECR